MVCGAESAALATHMLVVEIVRPTCTDGRSHRDTGTRTTHHYLPSRVHFRRRRETLTFLALPLPFCQRLMHLLVVLHTTTGHKTCTSM